MDFKESETYKNLQTALQGEALAHLKYQFYKSQMSNISKDVENKMNEIIHNEKEHGKIWFKLLHEGMPDEETNLKDAMDGERHEFLSMYPDFAQVAYKEGYDNIGKLFEEIAIIEGQHLSEFSSILTDKQLDYFFNDDEEQEWKCLNCGYIHVGESAPEKCPICDHPQKYFTRD